MSNKKNDSEGIIYSVVGAGIICYFIPLYIPYFVFGAGLLGSLYRIVDIINKSEYYNSNYIEKEEIEYFKQ